jgi:hypothetical protein
MCAFGVGWIVLERRHSWFLECAEHVEIYAVKVGSNEFWVKLADMF